MNDRGNAALYVLEFWGGEKESMIWLEDGHNNKAIVPTIYLPPKQ